MQNDLSKIVIIIPSLNPDEKFVKVVDDMRTGGFTRFVIVDDGSDEAHKAPFDYARSLGYPVLVHEVNKGKGRALRDAFDYVDKNMTDAFGVITIDGDGQHTAADSLKLAEGLFAEPDKVMMGCRDFSQSNVPTRNMLGNRITSGVFRFLCGIRLSDTQTGLRGFPFRYLREFADDVEGERFEYETNQLLYMHDHGIEFTEISIETVYIEENKSSHFDPVRDSFKIYKVIFNGSTMMRHMFVSVVCTVLDLVVFSILDRFFGHLSPLILSLLLTTGVARIISCTANYTLGRNFVFRSKTDIGPSLTRFIILAVCQWALSWLGLTAITSVLHAKGLIRTGLKLVVDFALFLVSYYVQKYWVYK